MSITYVKGDLFQLTKQATKQAPVVLAHACNCYGVWGGGIALQFRNRYPGAYTQYHEWCEQHTPSELLGTSLVIPGDDGKEQIACLFTSEMGGESPGEIAATTKDCMVDLKKQLGDEVTINMPKINAGIFGVPWSATERALKQSGAKCRVFEL